ncbi:unnamed protein product, partial [Polarella glacialis]
LTFPIDFAKTRMQLHVGRQTFRSALATALKNEGVGAVYAGLPPAVLRHIVYSSLRISLYEDLRVYFAAREGSERGAAPSMASRALAGLLAGGLAQAVASPADRIKVVLVKEGSKRGMVTVIRDILREEGPRGFYRGLVPNVQRAALVNLGELATYDQAKGMILESSSLQDGVAVHTLSALCSGFVASVCATPADVVKSRIMAGQASSIVDCVRDTVRNEGIAAMWKGFLPNWARLGPWQLTFWVSYEYLRKTSGYGSF